MCHSGTDRTGRHSHHQILGRLVEHPAPGRKHHERQDRARLSGATHDHDAGLCAFVPDPVDGAHPHRDPGAACPCLDARGRVMNFDMGAYGVYIWPAYGISALAILGAIVWTLAAWRRAKAKLAALEKRNP